jgi:hypothetical protein
VVIGVKREIGVTGCEAGKKWYDVRKKKNLIISAPPPQPDSFPLIDFHHLFIMKKKKSFSRIIYIT